MIPALHTHGYLVEVMMVIKMVQLAQTNVRWVHTGTGYWIHSDDDGRQNYTIVSMSNAHLCTKMHTMIKMVQLAVIVIKIVFLGRHCKKTHFDTEIYT